eukprot:TRINITY_DN1332_c0_g1_i3.p3 TRINITY_DN1332_c0_g1~~TRINITY_DN1332_c0_g1_i3.p3  ORF type:complete len:117 (-),score=5.36 TRINITY_DN1332_c0_g1_i3:138-488(-)
MIREFFYVKYFASVMIKSNCKILGRVLSFYNDKIQFKTEKKNTLGQINQRRLQYGVFSLLYYYCYYFWLVDKQNEFQLLKIGVLYQSLLIIDRFCQIKLSLMLLVKKIVGSETAFD